MAVFVFEEWIKFTLWNCPLVRDGNTFWKIPKDIVFLYGEHIIPWPYKVYLFVKTNCVLRVSILPLSTIFLFDFRTVPTVWYFLFFYLILDLFRQCGIFCFSIWFWTCSDSVVFFVFLFDFGPVPTVSYFLFFYLILDLFRQCGICFFLFDFGPVPTVWYFFVFLFDFGPVPTVWYFLFFYLILDLFRQCRIFCFSIWFWTCSDSVVFVFFYLILDLFRQCGIFCFSIWFWTCSDSVVFFVFLFDFGPVPTVSCFFIFQFYYIVLYSCIPIKMYI